MTEELKPCQARVEVSDTWADGGGEPMICCCESRRGKYCYPDDCAMNREPFEDKSND